MTSINQLAAGFHAQAPVKHKIDLELGDCRIRVATNHDQLHERLSSYFRHLVVAVEDAADMAVTALEMPEPELGVAFTDWKRPPGKKRRKEEYADIEGGRIVRKVRTGMQFLIGGHERLAFGPCWENDNQIINFINAQYMMWLLHRNYVLCHAAGVVHNGKGIAIAATSGGGKSTTMLKLMSRGTKFCTNDRLVARREEDGSATMAGIPKLPRINPGTIRFNEDLHPVMDEGRLAEVMEMPQESLWDLEEKHDVDVLSIFGPGTIQMKGPLTAFYILNWDRDSDEDVSFEQIDLAEREDLMGDVAKSPGPFYAPPNGNPPAGQLPVENEPYYRELRDVPVYEVTGGIDFEKAADMMMEQVSR